MPFILTLIFRRHIMRNSLLVIGLSIILFCNTNAMMSKNNPADHHPKSNQLSKPLFKKLKPTDSTQPTDNSPDKGPSENDQSKCTWYDNPFSPWIKQWEIIPVAKYELKNPTFHMLIVPKWHQIVFRNEIFWERIDLRQPQHKNIPVHTPFHVRYDTAPDKIMNSLAEAFRPEKITLLQGHITVLDENS